MLNLTGDMLFIDKKKPFSGPTARVTRWWAGQDNTNLTEPASSQERCLKTRRLPPL